MTTDQVLDAIRQEIAEEEANTTWDNDELLEWVETSRRKLSTRGVATMASYTVVAVQGNVAYGISPDMTEVDGQLVVLHTALQILDYIYRDRLKRGALAVTWSSGLESESTISADASWKRMLSNRQQEFDAQLIIHRNLVAASRPQ